MFPSQPSPSGWNPSLSLAGDRVWTEISTTENTCESICERDGKLWRDRGNQAYPSISRGDDGKIWIEWTDAGTAYHLDLDEARWLIKNLTAIAEIPAKKKGRPKTGQAKPWEALGMTKSTYYNRKKERSDG